MGPVAGPPGSGKTTFLLALIKIALALGLKIVFVQSKDCNKTNNEGKIEIRGASSLVVKRISSVLQFTVSDGFRPAFDALSTSGCIDINCLFEFIDKKFKADVASWVEPRLKMLMQFINGDTIVIPTCINEDYDELARRIIIGLLYVMRSKIGVPIILDDMLSFVVNEIYGEAFSAMMRPYIVSLNRDLQNNEILKFNPVVIVPGGHGGFYRLSEPHKYVVLFDENRWAIPRKDVEKIAYS